MGRAGRLVLVAAVILGVPLAPSAQGVSVGQDPVGQPAPQFKLLHGPSGPSEQHSFLNVPDQQMNSDERLRQAYEYCLTDFKKVREQGAVSQVIEFTDPACTKIQQRWEGGAKRRYEAELESWRRDRAVREKALIDQVAGEQN